MVVRDNLPGAEPDPVASETGVRVSAPPVPYAKCFLAALPELLLGVQFALGNWRIFTPAMRPGAFGTVMQIEFFVIHSTVFLGLVGLVRPDTPHQQLGRNALFWGLCAFYLLVAFATGFWVGLGFAAVMLTTNIGILMTWRTATATAQLVVRWAATTILFMAAAAFAGMPSNIDDWDARGSTFVFGTIYFLGCAAIEMSGFFLRTVPGIAGRLRPDMLGDFVRLPEDIRDVFAATGRVVEPWVEKLRSFLRSRLRNKH